MLLVRDVMTEKLITLRPSDSLKTARETMLKARIRHLPILSPHGGFVGLLSQPNAICSRRQYRISRMSRRMSGMRSKPEYLYRKLCPWTC